MWTWLIWRAVPLLNPLFDDTPITEGNYKEPEWFTPLMQFNDRFGFIVWPALALTVVGAIVWGTLKSASHKEIPGPERVRIKKEIIHELRRNLNGMTAEQIAQFVGHQRDPTHALLMEMTKDGMVRADVNTKGATVFKLPGF